MNASFLQAHMQRRHPGCANYIGDIIGGCVDCTVCNSYAIKFESFCLVFFYFA